MFSYLPFPVFIILSISVTIGCIYYAIKYKKEQNKSLFAILLICVIACMLAIIAKCLEEWMYESVLFVVFMYASIIAGIFLVVSVLIIGIYKLFKGKRNNTNKPALIFGILTIIFAALMTTIILCI